VSVSKPRITIVGLGQVGASIGLALRQAEAASIIVGHDRDREAANEAKSMGAVDRLHWNLISACEETDLVILALPLDGLEPTMEAIGPELRAGCVVIDTASLKGPVLDWAARHLPEQVHFVGTDPVLGKSWQGADNRQAARADLFQQGLFCIVPSPGADSDSVKLVTDLVSILGASPLFLDAAEHDGLLAAVDQLPGLLALALLETAIHQPTWRELRKVAGPAFEVGTRLVASDPADRAGGYVANSENVLRWLDVLAAALDSVRQAVSDGDPEALETRIWEALAERQAWRADRAAGQWFEGARSPLPARPNLLDSLFGTFWRRGSREES
jgi:prephenate dehydrogenase